MYFSMSFCVNDVKMLRTFFCGVKPLQGLDLLFIAFMALCYGSNTCSFRCRCFTLLIFLVKNGAGSKGLHAYISVCPRRAVNFFNRKDVKLVVGRKCSVASCKPHDWRITLQLYEHNIATWDVEINAYILCCLFWCFRLFVFGNCEFFSDHSLKKHVVTFVTSAWSICHLPVIVWKGEL